MQRFATLTALLNILYPEVLASTPNNQAIASYFQPLAMNVASHQKTFAHNDYELRNHTRSAIKDSYHKLYEYVELVVRDEIKSNPRKFADNINNMFNQQIAIDRYSGFNNVREMSRTFITMNSTGLELSELDLLRADLVQEH